MKVIDGAMSKYGRGVRVLHILKNPTRNPDETQRPTFAALVDSVRENPGRRLLGRVAQRSWAIRNGKSEYALAYRADPAALGDALQSSAIVNLSDTEFSKTTGHRHVDRWGRTSDWSDRIDRIKPRPHIALC